MIGSASTRPPPAPVPIESGSSATLHWHKCNWEYAADHYYVWPACTCATTRLLSNTKESLLTLSLSYEKLYSHRTSFLVQLAEAKGGGAGARQLNITTACSWLIILQKRSKKDTAGGRQVSFTKLLGSLLPSCGAAMASYCSHYIKHI